MKTVSEESIRRKLGCVNFKIFYIRKHKPWKLKNLLNFIQAKSFFFCVIHRWREKLLDLIYGPTKTDLFIIISLYFWLPSIEMV